MVKVLMLTHTIYPLNAGDSLYNYGLASKLNEICDFYLLSYIQKDTDVPKSLGCEFDNLYLFENKEDYSRRGRFIARLGGVFPIDTQMLKTAKELIRSNDIKYVFVNHIVMAQYAEIVKKEFPKIRVIYISHDAEAYNARLKHNFESKQKKRSVLRIFARSIVKNIGLLVHKQYEKKLLTNSYCYFTISRSDVEIHKKMYGNVKPSYFAKPLIEFPCNKTEDMLNGYNKKLIIAGTMSWFPNVEGTVWFVDEVMHRLIEEGYVLYLVGNKPVGQITVLQDKYPNNVVVTGRVSTMDDYFELCDISVIPLFSGTGAKIKVLESIGRGIPTVCSSFAAKDYDIKDEILIADTPDEFVNAIHQIEESKELRLSLYKKMKTYYKDYMKLNPEIVELLVDGSDN